MVTFSVKNNQHYLLDRDATFGVPAYGQIPLCRLPRDVRDKPVTSHLAQIPLRLPRNFPVWGSFGEVDVMEFGL